jgi:hypothetical protein
VRLQALLLGEPPARLEELMAVHRAIYARRTDVAVPLARERFRRRLSFVR